MRFFKAALLLLSVALLTPAQTTIPLWKLPPVQADSSHETDTTTDKSDLVAGKRVARITGVSNPTITVYQAPAQKNNGVSVVVFPGGGYRILAYDLEGTEVCEWLNSFGATCVLLKYRVPNAGPFPEHPEDLADAQRAVRLTREHAVEWNLNPDRIGVLGFSAGGHLAAALSNHAGDEVYLASDAADRLSAKPAFAFLIYPGLMVQPPDLVHLRAEVIPTAATPPTFLIQAENDPVHVENTTAYYAALKAVKAPAEMHVYAEGGHGYGLRVTALPITKWPKLAEEWLRTIGMLSQTASNGPGMVK